MYICQYTNEMSKPGVKLHKVVTQIRPRIYSRKIRNEETRQLETVVVGTGTEIVKELSCSEEGVRLWTEAHPNGPEMMPAISMEKIF